MSYTFYNILTSDYIGDSLSAVNLNYLNLSNWVNDIQNDYQNNLKPVIDYYNQNIEKLTNIISIVNEFGYNWFDFQNTVQSNSSKWLQPITVFYPNILPYSTQNSYINEITNWVNATYPVNLNYVENQKIIVHVYNNQSSTWLEEDLITDYTICQTSDVGVCVTCNTVAYGPDISCASSSHPCPDTWSCSTCKSFDCYYVSPPYIPLEESFLATTDLKYIPPDQGYKNGIYDPKKAIPTDDKLQQIWVSNITVLSSHIAKGQIQADVNMNWIDIWESDTISTYVFVVNNCQWVFSNFLTP